ncbi:MAG TPA: hypothetical protein VFS43_16025 [Polyangiaceae bacterium]|nr:hypothetical protein [Polyangiaceae bacterium]
MPRRRLQLRVLHPSAPLGTPPERGEAFEVEAPGLDGLRDRARSDLVRRGYQVRVVSFTPGGMAAYVEVPP